MEQSKFKIEWRDLAKTWLISREVSGWWVICDTRMTRKGALRYARKRAGHGAQLVLTEISNHNRLTVVTYRRLT